MVQKRAKRRRKKGEGEIMEKRRGLTRRQLAYRRKGDASYSCKSKQSTPVVKLTAKSKGNGVKRSQRSVSEKKVLYKRRRGRKYRFEYNQSKALTVTDTPQHRLLNLLECMVNLENSQKKVTMTVLEKGCSDKGGRIREEGRQKRKVNKVMDRREPNKKVKLRNILGRELRLKEKQGIGRASYSGYAYVEEHRSARPPRRETKSRKKGGTVRQRPKGVSTKRSLYRGAKWVRDGVVKAKKNTGQGMVKALMVDRGGRK